MKKTFQEFLAYIQNPVYSRDDNQSLDYRFQLFSHILFFCILFGFFTTPIFALLEELSWINMDNHKVEDIFKGMPFFQVIIIGGIIVPIIEELLFRAPITLFKKPSSFKISFYFFTVTFGLIHIFNFETTTAVLILTPVLVLPQLFAGFALGFLRVRFGLIWSILLHCVYNSTLLTISFLAGF